jgi:hypothetical protein
MNTLTVPFEDFIKSRDPVANHRKMAADWDNIITAAMRKDAAGEPCDIPNHRVASRRNGLPVAGNTYASTLVTAFLGDGSITPLQHQFAALACFSRNFGTDRYKPLSKGEIKKVTAGSTTLTNATNFEQGDSTVAAGEVTVNQYTQPFQVSNSDLNSGLRLQDLMTVNTAAFSSKVMQVVTAPITEANFANYQGGSLVCSPVLFSWSELGLLWGALKKASLKNAVLDGEYYGQLINGVANFQQGLSGSGSEEAKRFGWNRIELNTEWTGAGTGVRGFICDPNAIGICAGLPLSGVGGLPTPGLQESTITLPGIQLSVVLNVWFSLQTRTLWASYDVIIGAKELDTTAGIIIKAN